MAFELRENQFCLFRGDKSKNPKSPDWRGDGLIGGKAYEAAIWEKQGARGPWFSMSLKPKQDYKPAQTARPGTAPAPNVQPELVPPIEEEDSSVPF